MTDIRDALGEMKGETGTYLLMIYAGFAPEWKWFANEVYCRLAKINLRQMGEVGHAELAVKLTDYLQLRTKLPED